MFLLLEFLRISHGINMIPGKSCVLQVHLDNLNTQGKISLNMKFKYFFPPQTEVRVIEGASLTAKDVVLKYEGL